MCGRARLATDYSEIRIQLGFGDTARIPNFKPSWNIAPTQDLLVALRDSESGARVPALMRWGLVPSWAKDAKMSYSTFNARADGIDTKPAFRGAWKAGRRCLVVVDGFYEWRKSDKHPFAVSRADKKLMTLAGLWETWTSPTGETVRSVTIITTDANAFLAELHDRMPAVLAAQDWPQWLGEVPATQDELKALLRPAPEADLALWEVGKRVGNVRNDDPDLIVPITPATQPNLL
jgi:putative SOS response-associated peptidase YedK